MHGRNDCGPQGCGLHPESASAKEEKGRNEMGSKVSQSRSRGAVLKKRIVKIKGQECEEQIDGVPPALMDTKGV